MRVWSEEKQRNVEKNSPERAAMLAERRKRQRGPWVETGVVPWYKQCKYVPAGEHRRVGSMNLW